METPWWVFEQFLVCFKAEVDRLPPREGKVFACCRPKLVSKPGEPKVVLVKILLGKKEVGHVLAHHGYMDISMVLWQPKKGDEIMLGLQPRTPGPNGVIGEMEGTSVTLPGLATRFADCAFRIAFAGRQHP